jgi:hypothetical protein
METGRMHRRLKEAPAGSSAEARAGALLRAVPEPPPLAPGTVARISGALEPSRRTWRISRNWRLAWAVGTVAAGSLAFAAASDMELPTQLRASLKRALFHSAPAVASTPAAPAPVAPTATVAVAPPVEEPALGLTIEVPPDSPVAAAAHARARPTHAASVPVAEPPAAATVVAEAPAATGGTTLLDESRLLQEARQLEAHREHAKAQKVLDEFADRFPDSELRHDANYLRLQVLLAMNRSKALHYLDELDPNELAQFPRPNELRVLHGELRVEDSRCPDAQQSFKRALEGTLSAEFQERAWWGVVSCASRSEDVNVPKPAAREYLKRFSSGPHADDVKEILGR